MGICNYIKNFVKGQSAIGLHVCYKNGDVESYSLVRLKRKNNSLFAEEYKEITEKELGDLKGLKLPIVLCITGSNVIYKKVEETDTQTILSGLIPSGKEEEFVYNIYNAERGYCWLSVIRKDVVLELINKLRESKLFVTGISIGVFEAATLVPAIEKSGESIKTGNYRFGITGNKGGESTGVVISSVENDEGDEEIYKIGDDEVSSEYLPAYSAGVSFFTGSHSNYDDKQINEYFKEYSYYRNYISLFKGVGVLLFVVLFINFLVFSSYRNEYASLSSESVINKGLLVRLDSLKSKVAQYKKFISSNSLDVKSNMSFLCDRVILKMPGGIKLKQISVAPLSSKVRDGEDLKYRDGIVHIEGRCDSPGKIDLWLKYLKDEKWLDGIVRQEYFEREGHGEFVLELKISSKK
jgi:hypothetical protein